MNLTTIRAIAAKADNPELQLQFYKTDVWVDESNEVGINELIVLAEDAQIQYRIKPNTITLNGEELPSPTKPFKFNVTKFPSGDYSMQFSRTYHQTEEDCQKWADALNKLMNS